MLRASLRDHKPLGLVCRTHPKHELETLPCTVCGRTFNGLWHPTDLCPVPRPMTTSEAVEVCSKTQDHSDGQEISDVLDQELCDLTDSEEGCFTPDSEKSMSNLEGQEDDRREIQFEDTSEIKEI